MSNTINEIYRRGQQVREREQWIEDKLREMELKDLELKVREANTIRIRRRLRQRKMEVEDRERRFPMDE